MSFDAILWAKLKNCASLENGKIPADQLPSFIDEVIEVQSYSKLPQVGSKSKIYYVLDTQESYRWGSSSYILVNSGNTEALATKDDIKEFVTDSDVDKKISNIEFPEPDLSDYAKKSEIPDVNSFVTDSELIMKADNILFTEDYRVNKDFGNFKVGDSVKDLSLKSILLRMLDLSIYVEPELPDSSEEINTDNILPLYFKQGDASDFTLLDKSVIITDDTTSGKDLQGIFEDQKGNVGYQIQYNVIDEDSIAKILIDSSYEISDIQAWDMSLPGWNSIDMEEWIWEESPKLETIDIDGIPTEMKVYTYNLEYTGGVMSTQFRFIIEVVK